MNLEERIGVQTLLLAEKGGLTDSRAIAYAVDRIADVEHGFATGSVRVPVRVGRHRSTYFL